MIAVVSGCKAKLEKLDIAQFLAFELGQRRNALKAKEALSKRLLIVNYFTILTTAST